MYRYLSYVKGKQQFYLDQTKSQTQGNKHEFKPQFNKFLEDNIKSLWDDIVKHEVRHQRMSGDVGFCG